MATRLLKLSELRQLEQFLPLKQELCGGRKVVLYVGSDRLKCKLIQTDEAWRMDVNTLVQHDGAGVTQLGLVLDNEAVWTVFPANDSGKKGKVTSYGLGSAFTAAVVHESSDVAPVPVPEPWSGYFDKQPVIPRGLEWERAQRSHAPVLPAKATTARMSGQQTISSMFGRAPMTVEPMDF